jgi:hypothetical protein
VPHRHRPRDTTPSSAIRRRRDDHGAPTTMPSIKRCSAQVFLYQ